MTRERLAEWVRELEHLLAWIEEPDAYGFVDGQLLGKVKDLYESVKGEWIDVARDEARSA